MFARAMHNHRVERTNGIGDPTHLQKNEILLFLKILEKVSFIIGSEASYVYILRGQKFIENAKNGQFD